MKRLFVLAGFYLSCQLVGYTQNAAVTNAILYQRDGNLVKAKQQIDLASEHEKTKGQAKTFYYKGLIYKEIYTSDKVEVKQLAVDPLSSSTQDFFKAIELENNPKGEYTKLANDHLKENWVNLVNSGSAFIQSKRYEDGLNVLQLAQKINPSDTTAFLYACYAAEGLKKGDLLLEYSNKLLNLNYKSLYVYSNIVSAAYNAKDYEGAIKAANKGLVDFPLNKALLQMRTLSYSESGKVEEGIEILKGELSTKPYDLELLTNIAVLYNHKNDKEKAMEVYRKIIAIEPHNFFANFNSCVINLQKGNELAAKKDEAGANDYFKKALENAKRAKALAIEDEDLESLSKLINDLNVLLGK